MKLLSIEKGCSVAIFFVYTSLAMVTSSKANVENSAKVWYVNESDSCRFLDFEINIHIKEFYENNVTSQEVM